MGVKDAIAHAKIYLLEEEGKRRVIVGSDNMSETSFSGRQAEAVTVLDDDPVAWEHFSDQYGGRARRGHQQRAPDAGYAAGRQCCEALSSRPLFDGSIS